MTERGGGGREAKTSILRHCFLGGGGEKGRGRGEGGGVERRGSIFASTLTDGVTCRDGSPKITLSLPESRGYQTTLLKIVTYFPRAQFLLALRETNKAGQSAGTTLITIIIH